jgi:dihydropteroate synthase
VAGLRYYAAMVAHPDFLAAPAPLVMGILNVTPDSFSDGGRYLAVDKAVSHALQMIAEGAAIIDVGGESTRPGAAQAAAGEEIDRVVPVIEKLRQESAVPVSVDTSKPEVMRAAAAAGATMLNDVRALTLGDAVETAAELTLPVCLMHMQGEPGTMQDAPNYADVVADVRDFLVARAAACMAQGIPREQIVIDPGFGFGKTLQHNLELLRNLDVFVATGFKVLAGMSRKSMIGKLLGDPDQDRLTGSVTLALYAARKGAHIVRVHDVGQTVAALTIDAVLNKEEL